MPITLDDARQEMRNLKLALTPRWTPLKPHKKQSQLYWNPAQFKWCPAGRRSGKTETAKRKICETTLKTYAGMPARIIVGAPTYSRVKEIYFPDLKALLPKHWIRKIKESTQELEFTTHWGATIRLVGMNKAEVVEGVPWNLGVFDELANYPENVFENHILLAFGTEGIEQKAWMIGVPDENGTNQIEYEKYYDIGLRYPEQKTHFSINWPSSDIVSADKIEQWRATMDKARYRQEVLGHYIKSGGKAFSTFGPDIHVSEYYAAYSPFLPIDHSLDFGVRPAASLICQNFRNQAWILDEIILDDGDTDAAAIAFIERCGEMGFDIRQGLSVYGDAAGRSPHSNTGESDYARLREHYKRFNPTFRNLLYNPHIKDSINAVRLKLSDARGMATVFIHPRCKTLIEQLRTAPWPHKLEEFHTLAAFRYYIYRLFGGNSHGTVSIGRADLATQEQLISARYTR